MRLKLFRSARSSSERGHSETTDETPAGLWPTEEDNGRASTGTRRRCNSRTRGPTNIMQLSEESKQPQLPFSRDCRRIKANGAIVVHRSTPYTEDILDPSESGSSSMAGDQAIQAYLKEPRQVHAAVKEDTREKASVDMVAVNNTSSIRSTFPASSYCADETDSLYSASSWSSSVPQEIEEDSRHFTALSPPPRRRRMRENSTDTDICETLTTAVDDHNSERVSVMLMARENHRLQIQLRTARYRVQNLRRDNEEKWIALQALRREVKHMQNLVNREHLFHNCSCCHDHTRRRRRSTGSVHLQSQNVSFAPNTAFSCLKLTSTISDEQKIKILLDEIGVMQQEEEAAEIRYAQLATKNNELKHQLLNRDERIRQLEHELQQLRLQMSSNK